MLLFDHSFHSPEENLACDEAILDACESNEIASGVLRFWESPSYFVVLGYTGKVEIEANVAACRARNIPILRRCSGGGTVLQGPGCLNYSLVLPIAEGEALSGILETNRFVMNRNARALSRLLSTPVLVQGHSDLTIDGRKFSGNAQRRKRKSFLFHGTFLLDFDLGLLKGVLPLPTLQPQYRGQRAHGDFVINLNTDPQRVKTALREEWNAQGILGIAPQERMAKLIEEKYARREWNARF